MKKGELVQGGGAKIDRLTRRFYFKYELMNCLLGEREERKKGKLEVTPKASTQSSELDVGMFGRVK